MCGQEMRRDHILGDNLALSLVSPLSGYMFPVQGGLPFDHIYRDAAGGGLW